MTKAAAYRPIADYALIGNTHSAALVACDGSIDWCCLPHFDSGALFCRLLDARKGGFFRVGPVGAHRARRRYSDGTAVLETDFECEGGTLRLTDFMHGKQVAHSRLGIEDPQCHRLLRRVEALGGAVDVEVTLRPTFDFARVPARLLPTDDGVRAAGDGELIDLHALPALPLTLHGDTASARFTLRAGERRWFVVAHADSDSGDAALQPVDPEDLLARTCAHWREWGRLCNYEGAYAEQVRASARVLKLLTFAPTGALVAAPTTSLPEWLGGERNWDYRFCWLRDAALVLHALISIGYTTAAMDFFTWLEGLCPDGNCDDLRIMYRLDRGRELPELELRHLAGYRGSAPVRIGNAAASQVQLDTFGHVLDAAHVCLMDVKPPVGERLCRVLAHFADAAASRWGEPGNGIWEMRRERRHFLSAKLMCWVALDRALGLADAGKLRGDTALWRRERDALRRAILERGWHPDAHAFTQAFGAPELDASALLMPIAHFLPPDDPRVRATVERVRERLTVDGLVYRYRNADGVPGDEAAFAMCSYWLVDNLALAGRIDEARALFERIGGYANDLGLLSEEVDPRSGELLGNYPQGFTHLAQIRSALTITRAEQGRA